jgi:uncharacterized protein (DUF433 family)
MVLGRSLPYTADMLHERISIDPAVMVGKAVVRGTRITVEHILRETANGMTAEEIADHYPSVTPEDVKAALIYAADVMRAQAGVAAE